MVQLCTAALFFFAVHDHNTAGYELLGVVTVLREVGELERVSAVERFATEERELVVLRPTTSANLSSLPQEKENLRSPETTKRIWRSCTSGLGREDSKSRFTRTRCDKNQLVVTGKVRSVGSTR